ncbi:MAG: glycoside hydrolase family 88 protein [Clostridia bacterium]
MKTPEQIKWLMEKVNDHWLAQKPDPGDCAWERGAYFLGDLAAYEVLGKPAYLDYALAWADANHWRFYDADNPEGYRNADNKICGQSYLTLLRLAPQRGSIAPMEQAMRQVLCDPAADYWWWVDTIYMALPYYAMMGVHQQDARYFDKMYRLFDDVRTRRACYDEEARLWFRDERFLPERARTMSGKKVFWGRGNGWVFAGLARALAVLPPSEPHAACYRQMFCDMAEALIPCQQPDGFWRCSLIEPNEYAMPETSATALISYGLALGANLGILDARRSMPVAQQGYEGIIKTALNEQGGLGWVQVVADRPGAVRQEAENDYAVGTFLLLSRELLR